jgi:hypothetical protein
MKLFKRIKPVWKTRGGKKIPVNEMEESHLLNTYRFLYRRAMATSKEVTEELRSVITFPPMGPGDPPDTIVKQQKFGEKWEGRWMENAEVHHTHALYWLSIMSKELRRRGLDPNDDSIWWGEIER